MLRKRREPAPFFRMPGAPFNPATGQNAPLTPYPAKGTTLALFQVVEDDTHDNYVVCRGYEAESDPEFRFLHDPHTVPTTTPINVAKPYSVRGKFPYGKGDIITAARIKGKLGYNPGKAVTVGQPADLDEEISILKDDDDVDIAWMEISAPSTNPDGAIWYYDTGYGVSGTAEQSTAMSRSGGRVTDCTYGGSNPSSFLKLLTCVTPFDLLLNVVVNFGPGSAMGVNSGTFAIRIKHWNSANVLLSTTYERVYTIGPTTTSQSFSAWSKKVTMAAGDYVTVTYQPAGAFTDWYIFDEQAFGRSINSSP